jgi:hypothetical protein
MATAGPPAFAQEDLQNDPNLNPSLAPKPRVSYGSPPGSTPASPGGGEAAWGPQQGVTWIAASKFNTRLTSAAPVLTYAGNFFFSSPGSASPQRYYAQLDVEPGLVVEHLTCIYNDNSAVNDVGFSWYRYTLDLATGSSTSETIDSFTSTGSSGVNYDFLLGDVPMTVFDEANNDLINHHIAADVASDTSIAGCWAFWHRQVAPAPPAATFADVPTDHPFFRFVEALVASGITAGCGSGNYCPDLPVTRGQMAVFISLALGLGFPY